MVKKDSGPTKFPVPPKLRVNPLFNPVLALVKLSINRAYVFPVTWVSFMLNKSVAELHPPFIDVDVLVRFNPVGPLQLLPLQLNTILEAHPPAGISYKTQSKSSFGISGSIEKVIVPASLATHLYQTELCSEVKHVPAL